MTQPTRITERLANGIREYTETETSALSSVELSVNAKGQVQPSVKAYDADPMIAYQRAKAVLEQARKDGMVPEVKA